MWLSAAKIISVCNFPAQEFECMVCCPMLYDKLCVVHWLLPKYRKYYCRNKLLSILLNELAKWVRHFHRIKNPTGLLSLFYDVLPDRCVTLFGGMAEYMEYCKIPNIRNTLKHGIYRIFCVWFELGWQKSRGKEYSVVLKYKRNNFRTAVSHTIDLMTVLKAILTGEGSCITGI